MSVVKIVITAPALRNNQALKINSYLTLPAYKVGDQVEWGELAVDDLLKEEGAWKFWPNNHTQFTDVFWGFYEMKTTGGMGTPLSFYNEVAKGEWENQSNVNLLLRSKQPQRRLAMTLFQFTPRVLSVGSQGSGMLIRGNTRMTIKANPVIGQKDVEITDRTEGKSLPLKWRVRDITSALGHTRYQRLADA